MNHLRNDGEFVGKKWNQKESTCVTKKCTFFKVVKVKKRSTTDFRKQYLVEGVNDEKKITGVVVRRARVLYSTFLLHYLAVFGVASWMILGILGAGFLFYFPSLV